MLFDILKESEVKVKNYIYDDYDKTYGFHLRFLLSAECFEKELSLKSQDEFSKKLKNDLNQVISATDEYIDEASPC